MCRFVVLAFLCKKMNRNQLMNRLIDATKVEYLLSICLGTRWLMKKTTSIKPLCCIVNHFSVRCIIANPTEIVIEHWTRKLSPDERFPSFSFLVLRFFSVNLSFSFSLYAPILAFLFSFGSSIKKAEEECDVVWRKTKRTYSCIYIYIYIDFVEGKTQQHVKRTQAGRHCGREKWGEHVAQFC